MDSSFLGKAQQLAVRKGWRVTDTGGYKSAANGIPNSAWCKALKPPSLVGVFLENVETLRSPDFEAGVEGQP